MMKHTLLIGLTLSAMLGLVGCNTLQNNTPDNQNSETVSVAGIVGGSNSVLTLNGKPLDLSGATYISGLSAQATASERVKPGMEIVGDGQNSGGKLKMRSLEVRWRARGTVDQVNTTDSYLDVVGIRGLVDSNTRIFRVGGDGSETVLTLADLKAGDYVKLAGLPKDDDSVQATRLEVISGDSKADFFVKIRNLDSTAKTFTYGIKTYTVNYSNAQVIGTLSEGGVVRVKGAQAAPSITAELVKAPQTEKHPRGRGSELKGVISSLDTTTKTFKLGDYTVNYSSATVKGTLTDGVVVEVRGSVASDNTVAATHVWVDDGSSRPGDRPKNPGFGSRIEGVVSAFDAAGKTLKIAGVSVTVKSTTVYQINHASVSAETFWGTSRDGQQAEAKGVISNATLEADKLEIE